MEDFKRKLILQEMNKTPQWKYDFLNQEFCSQELTEVLQYCFYSPSKPYHEYLLLNLP